MQIRQAVEADVIGLSRLLEALAAAGKRSLPFDEGFVLDRYVAHPDNIACHVATDDTGQLLGMQVLMRAMADNTYGVTPGWGIIGTHVGLHAARRGVGRALFDRTLQAAKAAGLPKIDATMGADSAEAQGFYGALGFRSYRADADTLSKAFDVVAS